MGRVIEEFKKGKSYNSYTVTLLFYINYGCGNQGSQNWKKEDKSDVMTGHVCIYPR